MSYRVRALEARARSPRIACTWLLLALCCCDTDREPVASRDDGGGPPGHGPAELAALEAPSAPEDNPTTPEKAELGRHLFYDTRLSAGQNEACATCHRQELAFTDGLVHSAGTTGQLTTRNSMSIVNSGFAATLTFANFVLTELEKQALVPLFGENPVELGLSGKDAVLMQRLRSEPRYVALFAGAFPERKDPFSVNSVIDALASFERTVSSARSPYDRFSAGDQSALDDSAQRGLELFSSERLGCTHCHGGLFFSAAMALPSAGGPQAHFENNGLHATYPAGNRGLYELTGDSGDIGKFKAPSLRNIAVTAPYMHDGSLASLEHVIDHYARGGESGPTKSPLITGFVLFDEEREDLLAFLSSLTDAEALRDPRFANPW